MSDTNPNQQQNTPSIAELDAQLLADEAARVVPDVEPEPEAVETAPEPEAEPEPEEKADDEFEKRISRMAYEKRAAEKEARQLRERLARLEGGAQPQLNEDENARVERRAAEMAAMTAYNDKANSIYKTGVAEFPDFEVKIAALRDIGGIPPQLVEAADEAGDPAKILYYLGRNIDEAERIVAMPPHKMGAALAKIAVKLAAPPPKPQSKAPAPIKPLAGQARAELDDETMPIAEWMRREDERQANRGRRY